MRGGERTCWRIGWRSCGCWWPICHRGAGCEEIKRRLRIDEECLDELEEAWVPVVSPVGRGVLLCKNCD